LNDGSSEAEISKFSLDSLKFKKETIMTLCDLCDENEGNIWCRTWSGYRGTPLFHMCAPSICSDCSRNRKDEVDELIKSELEKSRLSMMDGLKKMLHYDEINTSGMREFCFEYWFKEHEWNDLKQYEEYLGFELSDKFKKEIINLTCCECNKHIRKLTEEEIESIIKTLPPLGERPDAFTEEERENPIWFENKQLTAEGMKEFGRRYDEYHKAESDAYDNVLRIWGDAFTILYKAIKYAEERPSSTLNKEEYDEAFVKYQKSKIQYYFCSKDCMEKDDKLMWVYF
jgi:hypothetical protein